MPGRQLSGAAAGILALVAFATAAQVATGFGRVPATAAGGALALACVSSPAAAFLALGLLAPFDGYITPMVLYRDLLAVDLIGVALIVGEWRRGWRWPARPAAGAAIVALLALVTLHVVAVGPLNWVQAWDNVARLAFWCAVLAAFLSAAQTVPVRVVCVGLVIGIFARYAYESYVYVMNPSFVIHPSFQFGAGTSNPNSLAGWGACLLPLALALTMSGAHRGGRLLAGGAALTLAGGIVLSFSKGSWIAAGAGLAVWAIHGLRTGFISRRAALGMAVLVLVAVAVVPGVRRLPGLMMERWTSHGSALSNEERLRYLESAADLALHRPLRGVGLERFGAEYLASRRLIRGPDDPHNAYLMIAVELGLPALGVLLLFQLLVVTSAFIAVREGPASHAALHAAVSGAAAALLVFQLFSAEPLSARVSWVLMAMGLAIPAARHREHVPE